MLINMQRGKSWKWPPWSLDKKKHAKNIADDCNDNNDNYDDGDADWSKLPFMEAANLKLIVDDDLSQYIACPAFVDCNEWLASHGMVVCVTTVVF